MKTFMLLFVLVTAAVAQQGSCPDCSDPSRPWMRGSVEIMCAMPSDLDEAKKQNPGRNVVDCHCQHSCDPANERADETDSRAWDAQCSARCSPRGCMCPHPCES